MNSNKNTTRDHTSNMKNKVQIALIMLGLISLNGNIFAQTTVQSYASGDYTDTLEASETEPEKVLGSIQPIPSPIDLNAERKEKNDIMQTKLSTLWTFVTLNMITADVLSLNIPEARDEFTEFADGNEANLMLGAAIFYQIPIAMVLLSKVLPYKANRLANIIAPGLVIAAVIAGGYTLPHYYLIASAEVVAMSLIAWKAWKWQNPDGKHNK